MKTLALTVLSVCLTVPMAARAADRFGMNAFGWEMARAVGDAHDAHDSVALAGGAVDQRFFVVPKLTLGFGMSQQVFDDTKPYETYQLKSGAITAKLYEFTQIFQLKFLAHYYFLERGPVQPFAGIGLGYGWAEHSTSVADFTLSRDSSAFVLSPEAGALFVFGEDVPVGLQGTVRYNYTTADFGDLKSFSFLSWMVGGFARY